MGGTVAGDTVAGGTVAGPGNNPVVVEGHRTSGADPERGTA